MLTQLVDQRGVDHRFDFDSAGRLYQDRIVNTVSGVDLSIKRIELAFDELSRVQNTSSYDADSGGNVVNQVQHAYNSWGLISRTKQRPVPNC